ncbi:MAG: alpha/beta hydrolase [Anaerolineae bacterium]
MELIWTLILLSAGAAVGAALLVRRGVWGLLRRVEPDPPQSPADYDLPFLEFRFPSRDGLQLHGWFIPAEDSSVAALDAADWSDGSRGTVMFGHGRFGSKDPDLKYVPWLRRAGYNVFMFDFRAHGQSEGEHSTFGYLERLDLLGAVDFLREREIERVGVLGFSLGGAVGIATAGASESIAAVICDGGYATLRRVVIEGSVERGYPRPLAALLAPLVIWAASRRTGLDLAEAEPVHWVSKISPRAVLFIHGGGDPYIPTRDVRRMHALAGEPKELWIVPEAGHRTVDEARPEEYQERVLAFFDRHLADDRGL